MRRFGIGITGALLLAAGLSGCGDSVDEGPVGFKGTQSPAIEALQKSMSENVKNKDYLKKPPAESKPADAKPADAKPAADKK